MSHTTEAAGNLQINYTLSFPEAQAHYMDVEMNISGISQPFIDLKMPVWTPGSYLVREYAKTLESLTAEHNGKNLSARKINKNTWHVMLEGAQQVKVKYRLYCFEISVRNNFVSSAQGFIVGANTFLFPAGMLDNPSTIHIKPYKNWNKVSTSLDMVGNDPFTIHAPNYDILYDSPIEVGTQDVFGFEAAGVKYEVAMCLGGNYDKERIKKDLKKLVEKETDIFGENPNKRYVFIVHNYAKGGGGLEHLSSTVLGLPRDTYNTEAGYQRFLGLAAHEHFHLWNVKRLRPIALGPFDYETENYTTDLWIAEGFTNYFDNMVVHRLGLYTTENYFAALCTDINLIENSPGNKIQPLYEASFDAWIKYYRPTENSVNAGVSYYSKGSVAAMMLDLEIIQDSKTRYSLDDVMKYMYTEYYKVKKRGYTDEEFKQGLEKYAGKNLDDFYEKYIYGLADVDYNKYLGYAGLELIDDLAKSNQPALGLTTTVTNNKVIITTVIRNSSAWIDGLNVNDEITAIDGQQVMDVNAFIAGKKIGDKVIVNVTRDGLPLALPVTLLKNKQVKYRIASISNPSAQQIAVREKWLKQ
ncbi:M61 family metallopeptidase [Mucilaginibacter boryungensis]|uniref:M61 family metallopeptidase n=1 Tax=Mucilaginibacter boryungensis TaxID=768480 RepID=A0ABR9XML6_9SPHI|nr:PDZ domain-containing protein [Mucilaginibacter boryungensis]MBE9668495.1 M61 family metallopeptidase [Mucilaginibacter boryungensis]